MINQDSCGVTFLIENIGNEELIFTNIKPDRAFEPLKWQIVRCKPGRFIQLPHAYYTVSSVSGNPCRFNRHYGKEMWKIKNDERLWSFVDFVP
jgi:hypothetical protein